MTTAAHPWTTVVDGGHAVYRPAATSSAYLVLQGDEIRMEIEDRRLIQGRERIEALADLAHGWDGDGSLAPTSDQIATAHLFWDGVAGIECTPAIGPANDGGVVFEWEIGPFSVYCYARSALVEVAAFDDEHDYVDICLPPREAAALVRVLYSAFTHA